MTINTTFFASQIEKRFALKTTDRILDYGCGPGFLADYFASKKIFITGADINKFYLEQSEKHHPESQFIAITTDTALNKKILDEQLKEKKFDFIVLLSIVQYFKSTREVEDVIRLLLSYTRESGKIIIADVIDQNTSAIRDTISLFAHCVRNGKLTAFFRFIFYLMFSRYRKLSKEIRLLQLPEHSIRQIAARSILNCEKMDGLTIHPSRTNYVLTQKR